MAINKEPGSFRDNTGFVFYRDGVPYRRIYRIYREAWEMLTKSGLYDRLVSEDLLVPHEIVDVNDYWDDSSLCTIKPHQVPFIVYPYEWCFSQLKDAALATLKIAEIAFEYGMTLRDASAYNIQFVNGKAKLIDTLSFGVYKKGDPWVAYGQFCRHFLGPLALTVHRGSKICRALQINSIDGIDLELSSSLLPYKTRYSFGLGVHLHLHSRKVKNVFTKQEYTVKRSTVFSANAFLGLISSLASCVKKLNLPSGNSEWSSYYKEISYSPEAFTAKMEKVREFLGYSHDENSMVVDIGANDGEFSRIAAALGFYVLSVDSDSLVCEMNYRKVKSDGERKITSLINDLSAPSPAIGWDNTERKSFLERVRQRDSIVLALALIHHIVIGNNTSFDQVARLFSSLGSLLIIEFVPKHDTQTQRLLVAREDIFANYNQENFERVFTLYYSIRSSFRIPGADRFLYLMERK